MIVLSAGPGFVGRKQVHLLMPEELHELVRNRADEAGVSLTAYVLSVLETDLNTESHSRSSLSSLALRVRAIEVHLGLDSRQPGFLRPELQRASEDSVSSTNGTDPAAATQEPSTPRRRASDRREPAPSAG
jgi:hypothetical protein